MKKLIFSFFIFAVSDSYCAPAKSHAECPGFQRLVHMYRQETLRHISAAKSDAIAEKSRLHEALVRENESISDSDNTAESFEGCMPSPVTVPIMSEVKKINRAKQIKNWLAQTELPPRTLQELASEVGSEEIMTPHTSPSLMEKPEQSWMQRLEQRIFETLDTLDIPRFTQSS